MYIKIIIAMCFDPFPPKERETGAQLFKASLA